MYDNSGSVLGAATATIILPATASAITGINYFIHLKADVTATLRDLAKQMEVLK